MSRDLAVTLAADVVGYRDLKAEDHEAALSVAYESWRAFEDCLNRHHGNRLAIVLEASYLARFPSALAAVRCAVDLQRDLLGRSEAVPALRQFPLRIGVNHDGRQSLDGSGPAVTGDYHVDRLLAPAEPGGLCLSRTVYDEVCDQLNEPSGGAGDADSMAVLHQEIRRIWDGLNSPDSSLVTIAGPALVG